MKTTRKLLALVLAMAMIMAMATTAFAAPLTAMTTQGSITIENLAVGKTYELFRILDLYATDGVNENVFLLREETYYTDKATDILKNYFTIDADTGIATPKDNLTETDAQALANSIANSGITADITITNNNSGSFTRNSCQYGYYVMRVTDPKAAEKTWYVAFTLNKEGPVIAKQKSIDYPTITKTVKEATAQIGEVLHFTIKVGVAAGTDLYTITDTMADGFTEPTEITVTYNDSTLAAENYTLTQTDNDFTLVLDADFRAGLKLGEEIIITYKAKLNQNAAINSEANTNKVVLDSAVEDREATVTVKTYALTVNKLDKNTNDKLEGAKFELKLGDSVVGVTGADGIYTVAPGGETVLTTNVDGQIVINGLGANYTYTLTETQAPTGYYLLDASTSVTIKAGENSVTIYNTPGESLPETGGMGTTLFYTVGGIMVLAAVVLLITKKRMAVK